MIRIAAGLMLVVALAGVGGAQYRNPVFLSGGYYTVQSTLGHPQGLWLVDAKKGVCTSLFPKWAKPYHITDAQMDVDNRHIVFTAGFSPSLHYNVKNGIFRFDPATKVITTIARVPYPHSGPHPMLGQHRMMIDQDGDYVFGARGGTMVGTTVRHDHYILKYDGISRLTTLFTSYMLGAGENGTFHSVIGRDIDSGDYLTNTNFYSQSSPLGPFPWILIDPHVRGKWSTFAAGRYPGYFGNAIVYGHLHQDYATGDIHEVGNGRVRVMKRGGLSATTLYQWSHPAMWIYRYPGCVDLQSAPFRRWINPGCMQTTIGPQSYRNAPWIMELYENPFRGVAVNCDPKGGVAWMVYGPTYFCHMWDFYRKRNIQTVKTAANRWQVRFSCPDHPGSPYVAAIGASGIRPGIRLASGRNIWLNLDPLVTLSVRGALLPFWNSGPGVLDGSGEAQGGLDTSRIAPLRGLTVWIALLVLDSRAPDGVAFIPDTYVMKLP